MVTRVAKDILLVDDDPDVLELMKDILECEGYKVILATDGLMGTLKVKNQKFDLIISDLNMPKQDGMKFLNNIAKDQIVFGKKLPPIIIITGEVTPLASEVCKKGKIPILEKPFTSEALLEKIDAALIDKPDARPANQKKETQTSNTLNLKAGEILFELETKVDTLYLIKNGKMTLTNNKKEVIATLETGEIIGTAAAITGAPSPLTAKAIEDSVVSKIPLSKITNLLKSQPKWFHAIILKMAKENLKLQSK